MEVVNTTKITKELNSTFQKIHFRKNGLLFSLVTTPIFFAFAAIFFVFYFVLSYEVLYFAIFFAAFPILFNLFLIIAFLKATKKGNELVEKESPANTYVFTENEIKIESKMNTGSSNSVHSYDYIQAAILSKTIFLLYIDKMHAFLVDVNGFTSGSCEELIALLATKLDAKKIKRIN